MKKIFRLILPCIALVAAVSSCQESLIDDKSSIDASHEASRKTAPTVTIAENASNVDSKSATVSFSISDTTNVSECGLMASTDENFSSYSTSTAKKDPSVTATVTGLSEQTTYYIKAYAVTKDGATVLSDKYIKVTTPVLPVYEITGDYAAGNYSYDQDAEEWKAPTESYTVTISAVDGDASKLKITNLFGGGSTIEAAYDAKAGTITIESGSYLFTHAKYGEATIKGVNDDVSDYTDNVVLTFTAKGGILKTSNYQVSVSAGNFGIFNTVMNHK